MTDDPRGRLDIVLLRLVEMGCEKLKEKTGFDFWNGLPEQGQSGMREITNDLIDHLKIPRVPIDVTRTLASNLGLPGERQVRGRRVSRRELQAMRRRA
jgi:hypothetical protein